MPPFYFGFECYFLFFLLEKTLGSPMDCKDIQPVHSKGDQSCVFFGRNDAKAETPVLWPPHSKSWLIEKDCDAGRDWGQEEKGTTEDEMAGWHHQLDGRESEWTPGVGDGQGGLGCCNSWFRKESDMTERLNWTELKLLFPFICIQLSEYTASKLSYNHCSLDGCSPFPIYSSLSFYSHLRVSLSHFQSKVSLGIIATNQLSNLIISNLKCIIKCELIEINCKV